eukprot:TRINITY_DN2097_c0_g1_i4.p1 TRINITY_DN2097_c0_g1~~TRINITY_DN2097_c0_g1_i4.p1  ORF type:complete len:105 (-),score=28.66 TRINITY_DN2097_c0_g1_i4:715-1029(-)
MAEKREETAPPTDEEIKFDEKSVEAYKFTKDKTNVINSSLISKYCLDPKVVSSLNEEQKLDLLLDLEILHLEWLNIRRIENLDAFDKVKSLYLQYVLTHIKRSV